MIFNLPTSLTWVRVALVPALFVLFLLPASMIEPTVRDITATAMFVAAAVTDWLDGYLARRLGQESAFGAFLDPVADKLMVAAALIILVALGRVEAVVAGIVIGREITISALREWMAELGARASVAVSMVGKVKTVAQMVAISFLLYDAPLWGLPIHELGTALVYLAVVLTLWSMAYYLRCAWPLLKAGGRVKGKAADE
ncbi:MAG TPA: CDP-diacylglycerol--glycerol-3-phosphate 3-phosphatidyltransferase [Rhodocyclaceae bacterium]